MFTGPLGVRGRRVAGSHGASLPDCIAGILCFERVRVDWIPRASRGHGAEFIGLTSSAHVPWLHRVPLRCLRYIGV